MGVIRGTFFKMKMRGGGMSHRNRINFVMGIVWAMVAGIFGASGYAQTSLEPFLSGLQVQPAPDSAPNPYRTVENWAKLPEGRTWGQVINVEIDRDGKSIWVVERCGGTSCANSS